MRKSEFYEKIQSIRFPDDEPEHFDSLRSYYWVKHHIAGMVAPSRIVEIGVRTGYSGWAFRTAAPRAMYLGIDAYIEEYGGEGPLPGYKTWACQVLSQASKAKFKILVVNTDKLSRLPDWPANLYHIDGDHTTAGARRDLELCWAGAPASTCILVDDYSSHTEVRAAVNVFVSAKNLGSVSAYIPSLMGEALIFKGADGLPDWIEKLGGHPLPWR